jgi:hypothetical protein
MNVPKPLPASNCQRFVTVCVAEQQNMLAAAQYQATQKFGRKPPSSGWIVSPPIYNAVQCQLGTKAGVDPGGEILEDEPLCPSDIFPCDTQPGDNECTACSRAMCCDAVTACLADKTCACLWNCNRATGTGMGCLASCGTPSASLTAAIDSCDAASCAGKCSPIGG